MGEWEYDLYPSLSSGEIGKSINRRDTHQMTTSKAALWATWVEETLLEDIHTPDQPDPVPFLTTVEGELTTTDALDRYRYGKNDG